MVLPAIIAGIAIGTLVLKVVSILLELKCPECGKKVTHIHNEMYHCNHCNIYVYKNHNEQ